MNEQKKINWRFTNRPKRDISELDPNFVKEMQDKANVFDAQYRAELEEKEHPKYTPKCPTCGCPDVERIGFGEKVVDTAVWGFLARKPRSQFRCKACGYEW